MILSGSKGPNFDFSHQASPPIIEGPTIFPLSNSSSPPYWARVPVKILEVR